MKVVVVGAGALGSIVGAHLARAGEDVVFVARGERAAILRQRGIVLGGLADFSVPVAVATDPREVETADVLLVAVKTYDTEPALAGLQHLRVRSALSLQNGVLKNEQLASVFGPERVLGAAVVVAGEVLGDGAVRFTLNDRFVVGELAGGVSDRARDLAAALVRAGFPAEASPHVQSVEWSKYLLFVGGMALASLTRLPTAKFLSDPDGALLMARVMRELGDVAARLQDLDAPGSGAGPPARSRGDVGLRRAKGHAARCADARPRDLLPAPVRHQPPHGGSKSLEAPHPAPSPEGRGQGGTLRREAPHAADGRLVGERELREREIGREIVEDGAHALSDGDVALRLGLEVWRDEVADDAERLVRRRRAPLFVELDQDHRVGRPFLEARLDGVVHDLVGVDVALAAHVLPLPLEGHAPGTAVARRIAHEPTALAGAQHQLVLLARELEVLAPLRVVLRDHQVHAAVFDAGH